MVGSEGAKDHKLLKALHEAVEPPDLLLKRVDLIQPLARLRFRPRASVLLERSGAQCRLSAGASAVEPTGARAAAALLELHMSWELSDKSSEADKSSERSWARFVGTVTWCLHTPPQISYLMFDAKCD